MRDPGRIDEILQLVRALWNKYPDWRLGQLLLNAHTAVGGSEDAYEMEDPALEEGLRRLLGGGAPGGGDRISKAA